MTFAKSRLAGGLAVAALVVVSASPAAARGYDGRWRNYHHHDGVDAGTVFGVLLGVGVIAAIASASAKQKDVNDRRYDRPDGDYRSDGYRDGDRRYDDRDYGDRSDDGYRNYGGGQAPAASEDEAVDACAVAARDEASRSGGFAEVSDITGVRSYGSGFDVTGTVDLRSSYRSGDRRTRSFRCTWDDGQVSGVTFGQAI